MTDLLLKEEMLRASAFQGPLVLEKSLCSDICQRVVDPCHLVAPNITPLFLLLCGKAAEAGLGVLVDKEILTLCTSFSARRTVHGVVVQVL